MRSADFDIVVSGGGIAGLTAAAAFGARGFSVLCVDPTPAVISADAEGADLRTTAILQPGQKMLENSGLWATLQNHATPLNVMRIIDAGGHEATPRIIKDFRSQDVSDLPFGWNVPNWLLRREMLARLDTLDTVEFRSGISSTACLGRDAIARVTLSDGSKVQTRLVIAADGRNSVMRRSAGIETLITRYGQKALAFAVTHQLPHENVSTEIHRTGGPFTLVPLPNHDGRPHSAVVWMDEGPESVRRMHLPVDAFEDEMNARACGVLGIMRLATKRSIWPIISQRATTLVAKRLALIAEAAHVVPPIGAQGLNMSLRDTATLLDLAAASPEGLGDEAMLRAYERARLPDIKTRVTGIDMLNRASQVSRPVLRNARAAGLNTIYAARPVRQLLMQMGLGTRSAG